jgi:adenylosuccinate synthase
MPTKKPAKPATEGRFNLLQAAARIGRHNQRIWIDDLDADLRDELQDAINAMARGDAYGTTLNGIGRALSEEIRRRGKKAPTAGTIYRYIRDQLEKMKGAN